MAAREGYFSSPLPRVIAHRGLHTEAPENTLLAFANAVGIGVVHLETDVHASADGVAIISHDPDLRRVAGREGRVEDFTADQLAKIPLGEDQSFCTLAEALDAFPETNFNIDIKTPAAVAPTIATVHEANAQKRVLIGSFRTSRRRPVVAGLPGVATSISAEGALPAVAAANAGARRVVRRILRYVDAVQFPLRMLGMPTMNARTIRTFHDAGVEVHVWTINDPAEMERLLELGVDGLVTDRADLALPIVDAYRSRH